MEPCSKNNFPVISGGILQSPKNFLKKSYLQFFTADQAVKCKISNTLG